jgi:uncharacterized delta-60 repeat protein
MRRTMTMLMVTAVLAATALIGSGSAEAKLDPTFGTGGVVTVSPPLPPEITDQYVEGLAANRGGESFALIRQNGCHQGNCTGPDRIFHYLANGALDTTFDGSGSYELPSELEGVPALAVDSAGRPLIVHQFVPVAQTAGKFVITRLLRSGQPDPSFGTNGTVELACSPCGYDQQSVIPGAEGSFLLQRLANIQGENSLGGGPTGISVTLQAFNAKGAVEPGFGTQGTVTIGLPKKGSVSYSARNATGAVYLGGEALYNRSGGGYLIRVSKKGRLDTNFVHTASRSLERLNAVPGFGAEVAAAVVRPGGKIDLFGGSGYKDGFELRLLPNGKPDPKFGNMGLRLLPFPVGSASLGSEGAEMAVSSESLSGNSVLRILPGGRVDPGFGSAGQPLPGAEGDAGLSIVAGKGMRAVVLDLGRHECRGYCPSAPKLFSFLEGR